MTISYSKTKELNAIELISQQLTLPCGLTLPNRLVKCPMQETQAQGPWFDPPETFRTLYRNWSESQYGLLITGQVQIDRRFLSIAGDVCTHEKSLEPQVLDKWKTWARIAQKDGTPYMRPPCPSEVPVELGDTWLDKMAIGKRLGVPKAMTTEEIDEVVSNFVHGAIVAREAGFKGSQIHGAHGSLVSQFLSPRTNRRTDEYGGTPEKRMKLLRRLVTGIRKACPRPYYLGVKLNSADYMDKGQGLEIDEGLEQVRWLRECGMVDFVEISGGNAEQKHSGLHNSFGKKTMERGQIMKESTRIREAFYTEIADSVMKMKSDIPVQLSGGFRSRTGMADAIYSGTCDLIGLGRSAVLEPELPRKILLNPAYDDEGSCAMSHIIKGQWFAKMIPIKVVGSGLPIQFFYYNMRRLGKGLRSDPDISIPGVFTSWTKFFCAAHLRHKILASCGGGQY
ncbi:FMN-linked oxidoreductase [Teratosphaeria nubilosa]|uniref:FMN-linked oxidoreductase n=1 Tax=Teratosphaeria nubilosa TaxID=161662 RepID=A0A6G1L2K3_9PEZI|nr:FMN-linked oxidoreductase [Teratosphaeria nubilosa]